MNEAEITAIHTFIEYGLFNIALDLLTMHGQNNSKDPALPPLFVLLQERISFAQAAESEAVDPGFYELMERIANRSEDEIFTMILNNFVDASDEIKTGLIIYCTSFQSLNCWGRLDPANSDYHDFRLRASMVKNHYDDLMWLHERLADARSKNVLYAVLANWIDLDCTTFEKYRERVYPEYYDPSVFKKNFDEVFLDLGALGSSSMHFICSNMGRYKRIYCYDITPSTVDELKCIYKNAENVIINQKAAWSSSGTMYLKEFPRGEAGNQVAKNGEIAVETVMIDDDISEPITFIKMDIEGAEKEALRGCTRQIRENRPKLAICTYHGYEDIYAVPRLIDEIAPGYTFYMRYHGTRNCIATEFSLLAV